MANGNAALFVFEPAQDAPARATSKPVAGIEDLVGGLLTEIADLSVRGLVEHQEGGRLTGPTRRRGGELVAQLFALRQLLGGAEFASTMHRQAQLRLRQRHGVALSAATVDAVADELLAIVVQVDATMRAMAH